MALHVPANVPEIDSVECWFWNVCRLPRRKSSHPLTVVFFFVCVHATWSVEMTAWRHQKARKPLLHVAAEPLRPFSTATCCSLRFYSSQIRQARKLPNCPQLLLKNKVPLMNCRHVDGRLIAIWHMGIIVFQMYPWCSYTACNVAALFLKKIYIYIWLGVLFETQARRSRQQTVAALEACEEKAASWKAAGECCVHVALEGKTHDDQRWVITV